MCNQILASLESSQQNSHCMSLVATGGTLCTQNILIKARTTAAKHCISNPAGQMAKSSLRAALLSVGRQHAWTIRHFSCLPFPSLALLTPNEIWGITSHPQAPPAQGSLLRWGIYLQAQGFKEVLHLFIKNQILSNLQVSRSFSCSSCSASWATFAVNLIHNFVGN